jgi:hypothetical protein
MSGNEEEVTFNTIDVDDLMEAILDLPMLQGEAAIGGAGQEGPVREYALLTDPPIRITVEEIQPE